MMDQLIEAVTVLVGEEYKRAAAKFGPKNNSPHESYAVLLEETEEAQEQMETLNQQLAFLWAGVKADEPSFQLTHLSLIKRAAILGACELIQVAAMADKALMGYDKKEEQ